MKERSWYLEEIIGSKAPPYSKAITHVFRDESDPVFYTKEGRPYILRCPGRITISAVKGGRIKVTITPAKARKKVKK